MINEVKNIIVITIIMSSLSEKVTSIVTHPLTGIVSGVYLTGVGLCAIRKLYDDSDKNEKPSNTLVVASWLTGIVGASTLLLTARVGLKALKND